MKKKKILFVASLPAAKFNFDGERNKSRDVLNVLKRDDRFSITVINLSKNRIFQTMKMIYKHIFFKYYHIFISKCIVGGSFAIHILQMFKKTNNIYFYIIGNGYCGFDNKTIYFKNIAQCKHLIVESNEVKDSMVIKNIQPEKISIFPCLKPTYKIDVIEKDYSVKRPLKLIFFSRINPDKGLGDLMRVLIDINESSETPLFYLDIAGGVSKEPGIKQFNEFVVDTCKKYTYFNYLGLTLKIDGIESYKKLQEYDLHVFPTRFKQECAPGSVLDMFIAGVPTLSAMFPSYKCLLNETNSILFEQSNTDDMKNKLIYIYHNASKILNKKRHLSHWEYFKYTDTAFIIFLKGIGLN